jgi:hypothetical protein
MAGGKIRVRFASNSGHQGGRDRCPLSAKSGLVHRSKARLYSITGRSRSLLRLFPSPAAKEKDSSAGTINQATW